MLSLRYVCLGLLAMLIGWSAGAGNALAAAAEAEGQGMATLVVRIGQVDVKKPEAEAWTSAKKGMILFSGDTVKTRELSRAALLLQDGSLVRLNENTTLQLEPKKAQKNRLKLLLGNLWARISRQDHDLEIETPSAVAAIKGTELELKSGEAQATLIVWIGLVSFLNQFGEVVVKSGQQSTAEQDKAPGQPVEVDLKTLEQWFENVVETPSARNLKVKVRDAGGQTQTIDLQYQKQ